MRYSSGFPVVSLLGFFVAVGFSQTPVPQAALSPAAIQGCTLQAESFLQARLPTWQSRLQLSEWKLSVLVSPERDLKPNTLGNIHWDAQAKTATIRVLNPAGYQQPCPAVIKDMENTLVHEMVHLELSSLPRSTASRKDEETAVNRITAALLQLGSAETSEPLRTAADESGADRVKATPIKIAAPQHANN